MRVVVLVKAQRRTPAGPDRHGGHAPCERTALRIGASLAAEGDHELVVLTAGPPCDAAILQNAATAGASRAIRVWVPSEHEARLEVDARAVAELLAAALRKTGYDLVLAGDHSADWASGFVGFAVAHALSLPHLSGVGRASFVAGERPAVHAERVARPQLAARVPLPAVLTTSAAAAPPLLSSSDPPPIEQLTAADVGFSIDDHLPWSSPPLAAVDRARAEVLADPQQLARRLRALGVVR